MGWENKGIAASLASCAVMASAAVRAEMPAPDLLEAAEAKFPFVEAGEGEPVLFVHGAVGDYRKWDGLWEDVAAEHRFMAYTQRWFGTGEWPRDKSYSRDVHSDDLVAVLQAIGEAVHLVGLSNGGPPALWAAIKAPELVRSLVLYEANLPDVLFGSTEGEEALGAFFGGFGDVEAALEAKDDAEAARELIEAIYGLPEAGFASIDAVQQAMVLDNAHTMPLLFNQPDAIPIGCDELAKIKTPTLVIAGAETLKAWSLEAETIAGCVPGATLAVLEGVGHNGPVEAKDAFVKLTLDFVDAHSAP
jgi:pimeloyl-ACP methyl ester carboxylesterase